MHFKKWIYKIWVDKDSEFYSRAIKSYIEDNDIKFNNTYHRKIKLKPSLLRILVILTLMLKVILKILS